MPAWLTTILITAAVLLAAWWAETRAGTIIAELQAIHEDLDQLCAPGDPEEDGEEIGAQEAGELKFR